MATVEEKTRVVYSIILGQEQPVLSTEQILALKEALYTLEEGCYTSVSFATLIDCWCLVQAALDGTLHEHLNGFRL